ncbi:MAG: class I tRNA ligase family protein, partial [Terriglobia bacterium]
MNKFYITTPIYYPNARPHVGSAYTTIVCDAIARYRRMCGDDVAFLTGTDEHGEKLQRAADAAGIPVEQFVAEKRELFKELWRTLGLGEFRSIADGFVATGLPRRDEEESHTSTAPPIRRLFVQTSQNPAHTKSVQWMIRQAERAGYIEKKKYEGRYCVFDERYVSDSPEPANCDICGRPAELIREENYFFKLSAFQDRLLKLYEEHPQFVLPKFRMNEVKSFVKSGLRDISISRRRLKWGIPWPDDPDQVVYVWYDALTSYLTGIGFEGERRSKDFEKYWPADVHMIGKDILRFHAVYWPAFLWAAGLELPRTIFAHGWIYYEQDKMSKSKGNVVYPEPIIKTFEEFGAPGNDALRYYLLRDTPFGQDGSFSYEGLIQRYNSDLANDFGNLANRTVSMIRQYRDGTVPHPPDSVLSSGKIPPLRNEVGKVLNDFPQRFGRYEPFGALADAAALVRDVNGFLTSSEPWAIAASLNRSPFPPAGSDVRRPGEESRFAGEESNRGQELLDESLYATADVLRCLAVLLFPFVPKAARELWQQLGCEGRVEDQTFNDLKWGALEPGTKVGKPEPIFPRLDKAKMLARLEEVAEVDREQGKSQQDAGAIRSAGVPPAKIDGMKEAPTPVEQENAKAPTQSQPLIPNPRPLAPNPQS